MAAGTGVLALVDLSPQLDVRRMLFLARALSSQACVHVVCAAAAVHGAAEPIAAPVTFWAVAPDDTDPATRFVPASHAPPDIFVQALELPPEPADEIGSQAYLDAVALCAAVFVQCGVALVQCTSLLPDGLICAEAAAAGAATLVFLLSSAALAAVEGGSRRQLLAAQALYCAAGVALQSRDCAIRLAALCPSLAAAIPQAVVGFGAQLRPTPVCARGPARARAYAAFRLLRPTPSLDAVRFAEPDVFVVLYAGPLQHGAGIDALLAAMPAVTGAHRNTHVIVLGDGTEAVALKHLVDVLAAGSVSALGALAAWPDVSAYAESDDGAPLFAAPWLAAHIHFAGPLHGDVLAAALDLADVLVFPPDVPHMLEALSAGVLPVVRALPDWADSMHALVTVLDRATVNRMRIPHHPSLCVLSLAESLSYILSLGSQALDSTRPRLRASAAEQHDWKLRAKELLAAYASF